MYGRCGGDPLINGAQPDHVEEPLVLALEDARHQRAPVVALAGRQALRLAMDDGTGVRQVTPAR